MTKLSFPTDNPEIISYQHPCRREMNNTLAYLADIWEGRSAWLPYAYDYADRTARRRYTESDKFRKALGLYLPKEISEPSDAYVQRLTRSFFKRVFRDAIERDFAPLLSRFDLIDVAPSIEANRNNFDGEGNAIEVVFKQWLTGAMRDGAAWMVVDYPPEIRDEEGNPIIQSTRDDLMLNRRPWVKVYQRTDLINWHYEYNEIGKRILTLAVLRDRDWVPVGRYGVEEKEFFRLFERREDGSVWHSVWSIVADGMGTNLEMREELEVAPEQLSLTEIPVVGLTVTECNPFTAGFPLLDLADMNLQLYQKESDKDYKIHLCCSPTLQAIEQSQILAGDPQGQSKDIEIGPNAVVWNTVIDWKEPDGSSITICREDISELKQDIDTKTLAFLSGGIQPKTATEVRFDAAQTIASIEGMSLQFESASEEVFRLWAQYESRELVEYAGTAKINQRVLRLPKEGTIADIFDAMRSGEISRELGLLLLRDRGFFPDDFTDTDIETELRRQGFMAQQRLEQQRQAQQNSPLDQPVGA